MYLKYATALMLAYCCLISGIATATEPSKTENSQTIGNDDFELFNVDGYRLYRYRSPTPQSHDHATTLNTDQLLILLEQRPKPILLDVQPLTWNKVFIQTKPRHNLPGSVWLPNVGEGELAPEWETWFFRHMEQLTAGNKRYPVVIYCRADCWMSWNALKRATAAGYKSLYWYRNGVDGWAEYELKTQLASPEPFPG